ncbi:pyridoxamine 5'-phosphate oxidase family protein [Pseudonocardia sp. C8]|uniref:pyridoxamine 5'-phosphate oxidase family protein n=1 Tax=Pseudonocardia sp. C8 TaxID=2762759 RepID=UPI001642DCC8|nr:pyridoxamine 5'-phosphate oxidase family protein [Pseudonocardia sp. C8]MBC3194337.1 pyridoxamine 5'-phosphate oxidase family protein [Pseudonocardia sp. C8]
MSDTTVQDALAARAADQVLWLGTVTPSGRPTIRPVWFLHEGGDLLVFSEPGAAKVRHVRHNPQVVVTFPSDPAAASVRVVDGKATVEEAVPSSFPAYLDKYEPQYAGVGLDRASFDATYHALVRITPTRTWGW